MAKDVKSATDGITNYKVSSDAIPKGTVFTEWDILFEDNVSIKKREQIIERLFNKVLKFKVKDKTVTTSLKYQSFKSVTNDYLYILRVYRESKKPITTRRSAKPTKDALATVDLGPIRTPGPPLPRPPAGVLSITDTVGLNPSA